MPEWSADELDDLRASNEIQLSTFRADGSLRTFVPVWVVQVDDAVYVRSYRGETGNWYRHARQHGDGHVGSAAVDRDVRFTGTTTRRDVIDAAYREKYGEASSYVNTMVRDDVASTTLRLSPKQRSRWRRWRQSRAGSAAATRPISIGPHEEHGSNADTAQFRCG